MGGWEAPGAHSGWGRATRGRGLAGEAKEKCRLQLCCTDVAAQAGAPRQRAVVDPWAVRRNPYPAHRRGGAQCNAQRCPWTHYDKAPWPPVGNPAPAHRCEGAQQLPR